MESASAAMDDPTKQSGTKPGLDDQGCGDSYHDDCCHGDMEDGRPGTLPLRRKSSLGSHDSSSGGGTGSRGSGSPSTAKSSSTSVVAAAVHRRLSTGSAHRRVKSDPVCDADKASIRSGEVGESSLAASASSVLEEGDISIVRVTTLPATGITSSQDDDLVQIGDGAFVSRRVYDLSRAAAMSNEQRGGIPIPGMSKLLNFAGRLPNLPTRNRGDGNGGGNSGGGGGGSGRKLSMQIGGSGGSTSNNSGSSSLVTATDEPANTPRRTNVLSKISGGLFGRQSSSNALETGATVITVADVDGALSAAVPAGGDDGAFSVSLLSTTAASSPLTMRPRSTSASAHVSWQESTNVSRTSSLSVRAPPAYQHSQSVAAAGCSSVAQDDISNLSAMTITADTAASNSEALPFELSSSSDTPEAATAVCSDALEESDGFESEATDDMDGSGHHQSGTELLLQSKSDSSITTLRMRPTMAADLVRHHSYDDLGERVDSANSAAASHSSSTALVAEGGAGIFRGSKSLIAHRSPAERVALTATQPLRRVLKQLMRRTTVGEVQPGTGVIALRAAGYSAQSNIVGDDDTSHSDSEGGRGGCGAQSVPVLPGRPAQPAVHRRSTSFSGRLAFLPNGRGATTELSIQDLVESGCSIAVSSDSRCDDAGGVSKEQASHTAVDRRRSLGGSDFPLHTVDSVVGSSPLNGMASSVARSDGSPTAMSPQKLRRRNSVTFGSVTTSNDDGSSVMASSQVTRAEADVEVQQHHRCRDKRATPGGRQRHVAVDCMLETSASAAPLLSNGSTATLRRGSTSSQTSIRSSSRSGNIDTNPSSRRSTAGSKATSAMFLSTTPSSSSYWRPLLRIVSAGSVVQNGIAGVLAWILRKSPVPRSAALGLVFLVAFMCLALNWSVLYSWPERSVCQSASLECFYSRVKSVDDYRRLLMLEDAQLRKRLEFLKYLQHETETALKEVRVSLDHVSRLADRTTKGDKAAPNKCDHSPSSPGSKSTSSSCLPEEKSARQESSPTSLSESADNSSHGAAPSGKIAARSVT